MGLCGTRVGRGKVRRGAGNEYSLFSDAARFIFGCDGAGTRVLVASGEGIGAGVVSTMMKRGCYRGFISSVVVFSERIEPTEENDNQS